MKALRHSVNRLLGIARRQPLLRGSATRLSLGRITAGFLSSLWLVLLARKLEKSDFAAVILVLAFSALTAVLHDGGQCLLLTNEVGARPRDKLRLFRLVLFRRLRLGIVAILIGGVIYRALTDLEVRLILSIAPSIIATIVYTTVFAVQRAEGRVLQEASNEVISRLLLLFLGLVVVSNSPDATTVVLLYSVVDVVSALWVCWSNRRMFSRHSNENRNRPSSELLSKWTNNIVVAAASAVGVLIARADAILLSMLSSQIAVANFSVGYRLVEFAMVPVGTAIALQVANLTSADDPGGLRRVSGSLLKFGVASCALLLLLSPLLPRVFGTTYSDAVHPFQVVSFSLIPYSVGAAHLAWLIVKKPSRALGVVLASLITSVLLHVLLTARYGAMGAAVVNVASSSALAILALVGTNHERRRNFVDSD